MSHKVYFDRPSVDKALHEWLSLNNWYEHKGPGHEPFYRLIGAYLREEKSIAFEDFWAMVAGAAQDEPQINPITLEKALSNYRQEAEIIFAYEAANKQSG